MNTRFIFLCPQHNKKGDVLHVIRHCVKGVQGYVGGLHSHFANEREEDDGHKKGGIVD